MTPNPPLPSLQCANADLHPGMQGIERVAVDDVRAQLLVTFFRPIALPLESYLLQAPSYTLTGGQRLFPHVIKAEISPPSSPPQPGPQQVLLTLDGLGDFSVYTLTVSGVDIDPFFSSRKLRFRLGCDEQFDCRMPPRMPLPPAELPVGIDYLAKDYASFRQALLDFVSARTPAWTERSEADLGIMLLELFAYTADNLSYLQDRVANEAFLMTATQRRSVAGHLQLIGYQTDEGAAAHTWLQFEVRNVHTLTTDFKVSNQPKTAAEPVVFFEPLTNTRLDPQHNAIRLYTWGNKDCCLPASASSAALAGDHPNLEAGDYLLIEDDTGHRDVVRLISAPQVSDAPFASSPPGSPPASKITIVQWSSSTPLHHEYCADKVTVRGNMVVATHGETVPLPDILVAPRAGPQRLRMPLSAAPLAHLEPRTLALTAPVTAASAPSISNGFTRRGPRSVSTLKLQVGTPPVEWQQQASLLDSAPDALVYRVEIDDQGGATVVLGRGESGSSGQQFGLRPPENSVITASYRVGGGAVGNVGADTLVQLYPPGSVPIDWFKSVTNPLAASGGRDLESRDHARRFAPATFKRPLVAVTTADYQAAAQAFTDPDGRRPIQRANAAFRWSGSWVSVTLGVDPTRVEGLSAQLRGSLLSYLDGVRLAGYDLDVTDATFVPIDLAIGFCVVAGFFPATVEQGILQILSNGELPRGGKGFFHPDNFSFGDNLYVSRIHAAVMGVAGVRSARITRLARLHTGNPDADTRLNLAQGFLAIGSNEIIQLDNDRNFPERGVLTLVPLV
jgi:hypothetical protein